MEDPNDFKFRLKILGILTVVLVLFIGRSLKVEYIESWASDNFDSKMPFVVNGYALSIDGKDLGILENKKEAEDILAEIKEPFLESKEKDSKIKEINFLENVKIIGKTTVLFNIKTREEILSLIEKGSKKNEIHIVEPGESLWTIADKYNIALEKLIEDNKKRDPETIYPGDEINLTVFKPLITVETREERAYEENIECNLKIEYDETMYRNESKVRVKGNPGKVQIVEEVLKQDGIEIDRKIIREEILSKPVDRVMVKGKKKRPSATATGSFATPTRGTLSSRYGQRWGRMHKGIDIAAETGTPIKAADGGIITYSGDKGNYGKLVEIDHGNGYITRYGHCSKIYVNNGEKISKDQTIALVGDTGRTTGPHLHFEVIKDGVHQNPSNYLNK